jgi:hypothetical protein
MRRPALPLARRFHARPGRRLRYWERAVFAGLHAQQPERRLWANVLADALYVIYRFRQKTDVRRELAWLMSKERGSLMLFEDLAPVFEIDPADVRRDVLSDVTSGKIKAKVRAC